MRSPLETILDMAESATRRGIPRNDMVWQMIDEAFVEHFSKCFGGVSFASPEIDGLIDKAVDRVFVPTT